MQAFKEMASNYTVLYVEDDPATRQTMETMLHKFFQHIITAENGEEGLEQFLRHEEEIDIVVSDISMPVMNGIEMAKSILERSSRVKVVFMSAKNDEVHLLRAIDAGVSQFIVKPITLKNFVHYIGKTLMDLEKEKKAMELERLSIDPVTGLPNHNQLMQDIKQNLTGHLGLLRIRNMGALYDAYGAENMDGLIADLSACLPEKEKGCRRIYRYDLSSFLIHLHTGLCKDEIHEMLKRLKEELEERIFTIASYHFPVDIDLDVQTRSVILDKDAPFTFRDIKMLIEFGDRKAIRGEEKEMAEEKNAKWSEALYQAIEENRLQVFYQPIVDNRSGETVKYEALIRMFDREGGVVSPAVFLGISQYTKLYEKITLFVLHDVFSKILETGASVTMNWIMKDIQSPAVTETLFAYLHKHPESGRCLTIEILETEQDDDSGMLDAFIEDLKKRGCSIAIDDFGSGYSNYSRLLNLKADIVKIDGSLIRTIDEQAEARAIVKSMVLFAEEAGLETVAEFVHSKAVFDVVKDLGVRYSQGYYLGKPQAKLV